MLDILCLDIHMQSPPVSPSRKQVDCKLSSTIDLQGAFWITGGTLCGRAQGNMFNNADAELTFDYVLEHRIGQIQVYTTYADPTIVKPDMELKHKVTPKLTEVLRVLSRKYSPIHSMVSCFISGYVVFLHIFLDENCHIFLHENSVWNIKGHYETAIEDDEDAMWTCDNGEDILGILIISILL